MASAFTHLLVGGALAGLGSRGVPGPRLAVVLGLLAVLPDADVIAFGFGIPYEHVLGHRGLSHSLAFAGLCGLFTPLLARQSLLPDGARWWRTASLGATATASHGVLDAMTNGGLGVAFLAPFSGARFFLPWRPLQVSPLSAQAFFTATGARVLASEIVWVWIPVFAFASVAFLTRHRRGSR